MKKTIRSIASYLVIGVMCLLLTGCGKEQLEEDNNISAADAAYPVTVTDHSGRTVTIEKEPESIVSGYYISTSMLLALGEGDKLVGIENSADKRPIYGLSNPRLLELPGMGTVKEFDLELCAALNPDLVVLPYKLAHMTESLEQLEIPVLIVKPETQELLLDTIAMLGAATNTLEQADELQSFINQKLELVLQAVDDKKPSVYLAGNSSLLSTAGPQMFQHTLIEYAGGENAAHSLTDTYWAEVSYEQILAWNPEYIILAADASYTVEDVLTDSHLAECEAVRTGHVYKIPDNIECWDSPVPGSVLGILWLASTLHPEQYEAEEYKEAVVEYYERFYGVTPVIE